jgi:hypothetical protein
MMTLLTFGKMPGWPLISASVSIPAILADGRADEALSFKVWCIIGGGIVALFGIILAWRYLTGQSVAEERIVSGGPVTIRKYQESASAEAVQKLDTDVHNELTEMRAYVHDMTHKFSNQLQAIVTTGEEREERLMVRLNEIAKERSVSVARLHDKVEANHAAHRGELDAKVATLREETAAELRGLREETAGELREIRSDIGNIPNKLIELLRNTGAIGRRQA